MLALNIWFADGASWQADDTSPHVLLAGIHGLPGLPPETLKTTDGGQHWEGMQGYRFDCELIDGVLPLHIDDQTGLGFRQPYIGEAFSVSPEENQCTSAEFQTEQEQKEEPGVQLQAGSQARPQLAQTETDELQLQKEQCKEELAPTTAVAPRFDTPVEQNSPVVTISLDAPEKEDAAEAQQIQPTSAQVVGYEDDSPVAATDPGSREQAPEKVELAEVAQTDPTTARVVAQIAPDRTHIALEELTEETADPMTVATTSKELRGSRSDPDVPADEQVLLEEAQRLLSERDTDQ